VILTGTRSPLLVATWYIRQLLLELLHLSLPELKLRAQGQHFSLQLHLV
jgi:hypothetical protein